MTEKAVDLWTEKKSPPFLRHQHDEMKQTANNMADSAENGGGGRGC
jgi:hypothetical protein